jgi:hypothetical protein
MTIMDQWASHKLDCEPFEGSNQKKSNALGRHSTLALEGHHYDGTVQMIDFDWCKEARIAQYPANLNTDVEWPAGVEGNFDIVKEHDMLCKPRVLRFGQSHLHLERKL